jgi:hypothetical protein
MQNEEDAQANNTDDEQIHLGCAFHRIESRGSLRVYLEDCEFGWRGQKSNPRPPMGLTSEKRNYNFHQTEFLSY